MRPQTPLAQFLEAFGITVSKTLAEEHSQQQFTYHLFCHIEQKNEPFLQEKKNCFSTPYRLTRTEKIHIHLLETESAAQNAYVTRKIEIAHQRKAATII